MRGFDEQLRFFDEVMRSVRAHVTEILFVSSEQVVGELSAGEAVEEELGVLEPAFELVHDPRGVAVHVRILGVHQRCRGGHHGIVGAPGGALGISMFQLNLCFENAPLARRNLEREPGDDLARALATTHVPDGELARVTPVGVKR